MARGPIFLSYRRSDSAGHAGRIYDRVSARYGKKRVFRDFEAIAAGADFAKVIDKRISAASAVIVVIGPSWVTASEGGRRRLHDPDDLVRTEVRSALHNSIPTIPVLVDGAELPDPADLPEDLRPLLRRNALTVREDTFDAGMQKLLDSLDQAIGEPTPGPSGGGSGGLVLGLVLGGGLLAMGVLVLALIAISGLQESGGEPYVQPVPIPVPVPVPSPVAPPPASTGFQPVGTWNVQFGNGAPFGRMFVSADQTFRFDVMDLPASMGQWAFDAGTQTMSVNGINNMGQPFVEQFRVTEPHAVPSPHWHVTSMQSGPLEFWPATP